MEPTFHSSFWTKARLFRKILKLKLMFKTKNANNQVAVKILSGKVEYRSELLYKLD